MKVGLVPNPTSDIVEILIDDVKYGENVVIQVINMMGQIVLERQVISNGDVFKLDLDLSSYPAGTYSVVCNSNNGQTETVKLVKL